jgi:hypothetical protein
MLKKTTHEDFSFILFQINEFENSYTGSLVGIYDSLHSLNLNKIIEVNENHKVDDEIREMLFETMEKGNINDFNEFGLEVSNDNFCITEINLNECCFIDLIYTERNSYGNNIVENIIKTSKFYGSFMDLYHYLKKHGVNVR